MTNITRRELELLLIAIEDDSQSLNCGISGLTRLQKLLYLLQEEGHIRPTDEEFQFEAYKAGPYSSKLYDDLEFLENLGLIRSEVTAEATEWEAEEIDQLSFDELMGTGDGPEASKTSDCYEEKRFTLTNEGLDRIRSLLKKPELAPVVTGIRKLKSQFASHSLSDLLYYVYTKYPDMTIQSEIKDQVLRNRRRR